MAATSDDFIIYTIFKSCLQDRPTRHSNLAPQIYVVSPSGVPCILQSAFTFWWTKLTVIPQAYLQCNVQCTALTIQICLNWDLTKILCRHRYSNLWPTDFHLLAKSHLPVLSSNGQPPTSRGLLRSQLKTQRLLYTHRGSLCPQPARWLHAKSSWTTTYTKLGCSHMDKKSYTHTHLA